LSITLTSGQKAIFRGGLITSLSPAKADPERLLNLAREHWSIENKSHYVRDVTFDEDQSQISKKF